MSEHPRGWGSRSWGRCRLRLAMVAVASALAVAGATAVAYASTGGVGASAPAVAPARHTIAHGARSNPFSGRGMWIWVLGSSNGGSVSSIIARARANGIRTLMIKSGDGAGTWSQFNRGLVSTLHANGFRVCAWQYVYGVHPAGEAKVGAASVHDGADCLLIDAEAEYEGRYIQAQTYIRTLRRLIGATYPVGLAGFPYIDYHPAFPYSVFMGPGGAQFNVPQMYWFDIGTSVDNVYSHTYPLNRLYERPISPLGQIYNRPPTGDIRRFRQLSRNYESSGVSWWDWQEGTVGAWHAVSQPIGLLTNITPDSTLAGIRPGAKGDVVVWAQEHLVGAGQSIAIDGKFGPGTKAAVIRFQLAKNLLPASGTVGPLTWQALLRYRPASVTWSRRGATIASAAGTNVLPVPASASLRARADEIPAELGAGRP